MVLSVHRFTYLIHYFTVVVLLLIYEFPITHLGANLGVIFVGVQVKLKLRQRWCFISILTCYNSAF